MTSVPDEVPQDAILRYSNVTVALHWTTVVLVLIQLWLGFTFHGTDQGPERAELFTWHKTIGALILLITLGRLAYRLSNPPPPYSPDLPRWERIAGTWNHRLFYVLLIALPLGGLTAVSAHEDRATTELAFGCPSSPASANRRARSPAESTLPRHFC
jgi:cytochrome b561